jgi:hypothetical protein
MQNDSHQRARVLIDHARVAGISQEEASWLNGHTIGCPECRAYAETTAKVIQGLGSFSFDIDPRLTAHVQEAVARAAEALAARRLVQRKFFAGAAIAALMTCIGSLASWEIGALVAAQIQIAPLVWRMGVALWSLPSLCVA